MSTKDTRNRIVSFRLSDAEYRAIEASIRSSGIPNVSLYARSAALARSPEEHVCTPLDLDINRLWCRLDQLAKALEEMTARLGAALQAPPSR